MIIVSQNKDEIVNFDNIINIMVTDCDGDFVISAIALVGVDDVYRELGYYATERRAKEILKEITQKYTHIPYKKYGNDYIKQNQVYEMPKE